MTTIDNKAMVHPITEFKLDKEYVSLLNQLKEKIKSAQLRAALVVNQEVIALYWYIGQRIIEKQQQSTWGSKLLDTLSHDLQNLFPETHGFSVANIKRMKRFAEEYPDLDGISAQAVRQLPWGHIILLIQKVKALQERAWYAYKTLEEGWSRSTLELYLTRNLYQQQAVESNKASNFGFIQLLL